MPQIIRRKLGPAIIEVAYFDEYLMANDGCFPRDLPCHALWYYYICATNAYTKAKKNLVYEDEPSLVYTVEKARQLLTSIASLYDVKIEEMVRYWPLMERQRIRLGGGDTLPSEYKFQFSVN